MPLRILFLVQLLCQADYFRKKSRAARSLPKCRMGVKGKIASGAALVGVVQSEKRGGFDVRDVDAGIGTGLTFRLKLEVE